MTLKDQLDALLDATVFDSTGTKVGAVRQVYVDDASGKITFATVSTGIFSSDAIVPLHGARLLDDELHVDHTRSVIRDSPRPDHTEDGLTADQEVKLLEHYGIEAPVRGQEAAPSSPRSTAPERKTSGSKAPAVKAPGSKTPATKLAEKKPDTSPETAGSSSPGTTDKKKTDTTTTATTTTSSPKPEVGGTREPEKAGNGGAPEPVRPAAPEAQDKTPGARESGGTGTAATRTARTQTGDAEPKGSGAGERDDEGGSAASPRRG